MNSIKMPVKAPRKPVQRVSTGPLLPLLEPLALPSAPSCGAPKGYVKEDSPSFSQLKDDIEQAYFGYLNGEFDPRCL